MVIAMGCQFAELEVAHARSLNEQKVSSDPNWKVLPFSCELYTDWCTDNGTLFSDILIVTLTLLFLKTAENLAT